MLVWLASYPRSGNGYARSILKSLYGVHSLSIFDSDSFAISKYCKSSILEEQLQEIDDWNEVVFVKTHHLPLNDRHKSIYIVRDGRDSLVSYAWFDLKAQKALWVHRTLKLLGIQKKSDFRSILQKHIVSEENVFGSWSENVSSWYTRPDTVVIKFEDLIIDPVLTISNAVKALQLPLQENADPKISKFSTLNRQNPTVYRRGLVGSWKEEFPKDLQPLFWQCHMKMMQEMGYS